MTTALDTIRYHSGVAGEEVADMVDSLEREVSSLREQVEKLTKERDELHRAFNQPVPRSEWEKMQEQLAALAEQNEKLRKVLLRLACLGNGDQYGNSIGNCIAQEALSLPDLAYQNAKMREALTSTLDMVARGVPDLETVVTSRKTLSFPDLASPILNRIRAEAYREAAMHCSKHGSRTADEVSEDLFAKADELEQSK